METNEIDQLVLIRNIAEEDISFIFATWLRGLYYGNSWFQEIDKDIFMENYHKVIESVLTRPTTRVNIACLKEDENTILGYAVLDPDRATIHWIHVKEAWRQLGLAKKLIPTDVKWREVTHLTEIAERIKPKQIKFNPFNL